MDRYQRVEKPRPETPINENEICITTQERMKNYIIYATTLFQISTVFLEEALPCLSEKGNCEHKAGDKIIMPPSALDRLASLHIDYPMLFELRNAATERISHCGVLEFIAEEGMIYMPYWWKMSSGGWIPVVKQRGKQEARKSVGSAIIFTVFVDNLPNPMTSKGLFNLFGKFGIVKDIFIPQKRRRNTNTRFGFVRYSCEVAANVAVQKANGLWVDEKKLFVKLAAFERSREQGKHHARKPPQLHFRDDVWRGSNHFTNNKTFADVVRGNQIQGREPITNEVTLSTL